jgi:hypothetical protein
MRAKNSTPFCASVGRLVVDDSTGNQDGEFTLWDGITFF